MKTPRFELKDFRLNEILSMLTTYNGPSLSEELNRVWTGEARTVKFGNRFSVDLTPEDVKENPEFRPNEWNPTKSWNIPKNVDLMFSIQEKNQGKKSHDCVATSTVRISEDQAESPCTHFAVDFMQQSTNRSSSVGLMIKKASGSLGTF